MPARTKYGDRWEIISSSGEGGQSHIFLVRDLHSKTDEQWVLKRLKNHDRVSRFEQEIKACQKLHHSGIAPILDYSLSQPAYFVTKHYPWPSLSECQPLPPLEALKIFLKLCDTVAYAHQRGVIHRDLKPENILLSENQDVVILDFGICYFEDEEHRLTETMEQVGSRFFIAPEFESGRADVVTPQADTYALGKLLYFLLSGKRIAREAFTGENDLSHLLKNPQLLYVTEKILAKAVTEHPRDRYTVPELRDAAVQVRQLISEHYYPGREGAKCRFCGERQYKKASTMRLHVSFPGREKNVDFDILICEHCRNVQWFNTEPSI